VRTTAVVNKDLRVKTRVNEDLVDRDLELLVPTFDDRDAAGSLYVPMAKIGLLQLELVLSSMQHEKARTKGTSL
jgi:hypothetical protein